MSIVQVLFESEINHMWRCWLLSSFVLLGSLMGCSRSNLPELGGVTGTVTVDGEPVPNAIVTFTPKDGRPSKGMTDDSGHYTLKYTADADGAMVGTHTVRIHLLQTAEEDDLPEGTKPARILPKEADNGTLSKVVKPGSNAIPIELSQR